MERPDRVLFGSGAVQLEKVDDAGKQDRDRYKELDERRVEFDDVECGKRQRDGMADGEAGHEGQHLPPVSQGIDGAKCQQKQHVVVGLEIKNMMKAQLNVS